METDKDRISSQEKISSLDLYVPNSENGTYYEGFTNMVKERVVHPYPPRIEGSGRGCTSINIWKLVNYPCFQQYRYYETTKLVITLTRIKVQITHTNDK